MKLLAQGNLRGRQRVVFAPLLAVDGGPRRRCMPAAREFLVHRLMTGAAIGGRQRCSQRETVMLLRLLILGRLVTIETGDAFARMGAELVFMDDRMLRSRVTLGAFPRRPYEIRSRLAG